MQGGAEEKEKRKSQGPAEEVIEKSCYLSYFNNIN